MRDGFASGATALGDAVCGPYVGASVQAMKALTTLGVDLHQGRIDRHQALSRVAEQLSRIATGIAPKPVQVALAIGLEGARGGRDVLDTVVASIAAGASSLDSSGIAYNAVHAAGSDLKAAMGGGRKEQTATSLLQQVRAADASRTR